MDDGFSGTNYDRPDFERVLNDIDKGKINVVLFGYKKDPNNKHKLIIDEEASQIVRYIYKLCSEGNGYNRITKILRLLLRVHHPVVLYLSKT